MVPASIFKKGTTMSEASVAYEFEPVMSMADLQHAIKYVQAKRPRAKLELYVASSIMPVNLLANGFVEFGGKVPVPALERTIEQDMLFGAWLVAS